MSKTSEISGPVNRNRRSAAITAIRRSAVRLATWRGAEERSSNPSSPSRRNRRTHLRHVRAETPALIAASEIERSCSTTSLTILARRFRLSSALA